MTKKIVVDQLSRKFDEVYLLTDSYLKVIVPKSICSYVVNQHSHAAYFLRILTHFFAE